MPQDPRWGRVILYAFGALVAYEFIRFLVVARIRRWMRAEATRFVRQHRVRLESARFIDRVWMRERLAWDPQVERAILDASDTTNQPIPLLREKVDRYVEEIAPYFSLATYYQFGAAIARASTARRFGPGSGMLSKNCAPEPFRPRSGRRSSRFVVVGPAKKRRSACANLTQSSSTPRRPSLSSR